MRSGEHTETRVLRRLLLCRHMLYAQFVRREKRIRMSAPTKSRSALCATTLREDMAGDARCGAATVTGAEACPPLTVACVASSATKAAASA